MHDSRKRQAARTTIVGGQPPGNARDLPPVPAGLEEILSLAAASPEFAAVLATDRARAAQAAGLSLSPAESSILSAVPASSLEQMIARVERAQDQPDRRIFLERAAAAVAFLLGGAALSACAEKPAPKSKDQPGSEPRTPRPSEPDAGAAAQPALPPFRPRKTELDVDGGARPDRTHKPAGSRPERPRDAPDPQDTRMIGGIRPEKVAPKPSPRQGSGEDN
ncbi:MAG: hypothetical protein RBU30_00075 [Polyangia bacterium]|jgi:hypothetical protein|nr:hypothetical protein [Polyangia bacterium]